MEINKFNLKSPEEKSTYGDYSYFVYGLVRQYEPRITLEVGLGPYGNSSCAIIQALYENSLNGPTGHHYIVELEPTDEAKQKLSKLPQDLYTLRIGDSKEAAKYCNLKNQIDILFVDGNHTTEYCYNDTMLPIMTNNFNMENGIIVFHDAQMSTVRQAINMLKKQLKLKTFFLPKISVCLAKFDY